MAIPKTGVNLIKVTPPFKPVSTNLVLTENVSEISDLKLGSNDFINDRNIDNSFKIRIIHNAVLMLEEFYERYIALPSCNEIFINHINYLDKINLDNYPEQVKVSINNVVSKIKKSMENRKLEYLRIAAKKPKALRLYEPNVIKM